MLAQLTTGEPLIKHRCPSVSSICQLRVLTNVNTVSPVTLQVALRSIATVLLGRVVAFEGAEDQDLLFLGFDSEKSQNENNLKKKRRV